MENSDTTTSTTEFSNQSIVLDGDQALNYDFSHDLTVTTNDNTATIKVQQLNLITASDIQTIDGGYEIQKNGYALKVLVNNPAGSVLFEDLSNSRYQTYKDIAQGFNNSLISIQGNTKNSVVVVDVDGKSPNYNYALGNTTFDVENVVGNFTINTPDIQGILSSTYIDLSKVTGPIEFYQTSYTDIEIKATNLTLLVKNAFSIDGDLPSSDVSVYNGKSYTNLSNIAYTNTVSANSITSTFSERSSATIGDSIQSVFMHRGAVMSISDLDFHSLQISLAPNDDLSNSKAGSLAISSDIVSKTGTQYTSQIINGNLVVSFTGDFGERDFTIDNISDFKNFHISIGNAQAIYSYNTNDQYAHQSGTENIITNNTSSENIISLDGTSSEVTMSQNAPDNTTNFYTVNGGGTYSIELPSQSANITVNSASSLELKGASAVDTINLVQKGLTANDLSFSDIGDNGVQVSYGTTKIDIDHFLGESIYLDVNGSSVTYPSASTQVISDDGTYSSAPTVTSETLNFTGNASGFSYTDRNNAYTNEEYTSSTTQSVSGTLNINGSLTMNNPGNVNIQETINLNSSGSVRWNGTSTVSLQDNTLTLSSTNSNGTQVSVNVNNAVDRFENGDDTLKVSNTYSNVLTSHTLERTQSTVNFSSSTTNTKDIIESSDGTTAVSISDAGSNNEFLLRYSATGTVSLGENDRLLFSSNPSDYSNFSMAEKGGRYILDMTTISGAHLSVSGTSGSEIDWSNGQHIMMGAAASVLNIDNSSHVAIPLTTNT